MAHRPLLLLCSCTNAGQKNIDLTGASVEAELILPGSNERLGALVDSAGSRSKKKQFSSTAQRNVGICGDSRVTGLGGDLSGLRKPLSVPG